MFFRFSTLPKINSSISPAFCQWYENQIGIYELMWVKMKLEPEDRAWVERDLDQIEKAVKAASGRGD